MARRDTSEGTLVDFPPPLGPPPPTAGRSSQKLTGGRVLDGGQQPYASWLALFSITLATPYHARIEITTPANSVTPSSRISRSVNRTGFVRVAIWGGLP